MHGEYNAYCDILKESSYMLVAEEWVLLLVINKRKLAHVGVRNGSLLHSNTYI
jgi:hypothetical protein